MISNIWNNIDPGYRKFPIRPGNLVKPRLSCAFQMTPLVITDMAAALLALIHKFRPTSRSQLLLGSGGISALLLVLRHILSRNANYISNPSKIGRLATEKDSEEYDIIIVGGGKRDLVLFDGRFTVFRNCGVCVGVKVE
jgi:hypothetical protein